MADRIMLIGGPDSGKTNYLGRLWQKLIAKDGELRAPKAPKDIVYVEEALNHLLQGEFAPRTDKNIEEGERDFCVPVVLADGSNNVELVVPDVSGELWKNAIENVELPAEWMDQLNNSSGALLFIRVLSKLNIEPLDWVTSRALLSHSGGDGSSEDHAMPTQVVLCELLRLLEIELGKQGSGKARVAVVVTAWDLLDEETANQGPEAFLKKQYPIFSGKLSDTELDIRVFGVSILGGDLGDEDFKREFLRGGLSTAGYSVGVGEEGEVSRSNDVSAPLAWVVEGISAE